MRARRPYLILLTVPALVLGSLAVAGPVLAAPCDGSSDELMNGGFEDPGVPADSYTQFPAASVPPWQTTDGAGLIEIWGNGFLGVPAPQGENFAELNATTAGTLYQDVISTPGATMSWSLLHRGRDGDDVMQVLIGDANVVDPSGTADWDYISGDLTDGNTAWGSHGADYVVPAGQTCTRFAFRAVSAASGSPSIGNLLDEIAFIVTAPPDPDPGPTSQVTPPPTDALAVTTPSDRGGPLGLAFVLSIAALASAALLAMRPRSAGRRD